MGFLADPRIIETRMRTSTDNPSKLADTPHPTSLCHNTTTHYLALPPPSQPFNPRYTTVHRPASTHPSSPSTLSSPAAHHWRPPPRCQPRQLSLSSPRSPLISSNRNNGSRTLRPTNRPFGSAAGTTRSNPQICRRVHGLTRVSAGSLHGESSDASTLITNSSDKSSLIFS